MVSHCFQAARIPLLTWQDRAYLYIIPIINTLVKINIFITFTRRFSPYSYPFFYPYAANIKRFVRFPLLFFQNTRHARFYPLLRYKKNSERAFTALFYYILSGALTPTRSNALANVILVAFNNARRSLESSGFLSSSTLQAL